MMSFDHTKFLLIHGTGILHVNYRCVTQSKHILYVQFCTELKNVVNVQVGLSCKKIILNEKIFINEN